MALPLLLALFFLVVGMFGYCYPFFGSFLLLFFPASGFCCFCSPFAAFSLAPFLSRQPFQLPRIQIEESQVLLAFGFSE